MFKEYKKREIYYIKRKLMWEDLEEKRGIKDDTSNMEEKVIQ